MKEEFSKKQECKESDEKENKREQYLIWKINDLNEKLASVVPRVQDKFAKRIHR